MPKEMLIEWTHTAWYQYTLWIAEDILTVKRINETIEDIIITPYGGMGNPVPAECEFLGCWARDIHKDYRLVYAVNDALYTGEKVLTIFYCRRPKS